MPAPSVSSLPHCKVVAVEEWKDGAGVGDAREGGHHPASHSPDESEGVVGGGVGVGGVAGACHISKWLRHCAARCLSLSLS